MRELLIFVPSIEDGGVEKNLFLVSNYLARKKLKIKIISNDSKKKNNFDNSIKFISPTKIKKIFQDIKNIFSA